MKKKILIAAIYLSGCVVTYICIKNHILDTKKKYTVSDKRMNLFTSVFSWVGFLAYEASLFVTYKDDTPANW